jgi:flagellar basal body-associated protein FliL
MMTHLIKFAGSISSAFLNDQKNSRFLATTVSSAEFYKKCDMTQILVDIIIIIIVCSSLYFIGSHQSKYVEQPGTALVPRAYLTSISAVITNLLSPI